MQQCRCCNPALRNIPAFCAFFSFLKSRIFVIPHVNFKSNYISFLGSTLTELALAAMDFNWLWAGLLFCLIVLTTAATVMGCIETLSSSIVDEWPSMKAYKPAITFTFLAFIFMINLVMSTQGGIYIYYLLTTYYTSWPLIFFGLLTTLAAAFAHGGKYLMKDLSDMSKLPLTHYINSHLSVLYITVIPITLTVSLFMFFWREI